MLFSLVFAVIIVVGYVLEQMSLREIGQPLQLLGGVYILVIVLVDFIGGVFEQKDLLLLLLAIYLIGVPGRKWIVFEEHKYVKKPTPPR